MPLRPYQARALQRFEASTARAVLIVAPTGAGKGTMAVELMARADRAGRRAVFITHRREILADVERRLRARGVRPAQSLRSDRTVRVLSVQTALRRETRPVDLLLVDEAHHYQADEWRDVVARIPARRIVGFTATPERADGKPLGDMFGELIESVTCSELLRWGHMVPVRVLRPVHALGGDLAQDPADAYLRHGDGQRALIYVRRVAEAEEVAARLRAHGVPCEGIYARTSRAKRDDLLAQLERGSLRAVVNVGTLTEGFDAPHVSCCVLARPCAHASTYVQIVGRVLRPAPGKDEATLIDLVGVSHAHGLPGADMIYSLEGRAIRTKDGEPPPEREAPSDPDVLGLELVTVYAGHARSARTPPHSPPLVYDHLRGRGFVYHDKSGFYSMRWTNPDGTKSRLGLSTKDRETAEATLRTFREHGELAARAEILQRKRRRATLVKNNESSVWHLSTWNDDRTELIKLSLYTNEREEAEALRALYFEDRATFNERRAELRRTSEDNATERRALAAREVWHRKRGATVGGLDGKPASRD